MILQVKYASRKSSNNKQRILSVLPQTTRKKNLRDTSPANAAQIKPAKYDHISEDGICLK
jgi:hypothetical protein